MLEIPLRSQYTFHCSTLKTFIPHSLENSYSNRRYLCFLRVFIRIIGSVSIVGKNIIYTRLCYRGLRLMDGK